MPISIKMTDKDNSSQFEVPPFEGAITKVYKSAFGLEQIFHHYQAQLNNWPVEYEQRILDSPYGKTYCLISGKPEKPPIVLLAGLGVNATSFKDNIQILSEKYRVYIPDFPAGSGRSMPGNIFLKEKNVADWLDNTISQLEQRKVTIVGVSFGSWLAIKYALSNQHKITGLVLTSPPPLASKSRLKILTLFKMIKLGLNKNRENIGKLCKLLSAPDFTPGESLITSIYNGLNYTKSFKESGHTINSEQANTLDVPIHFILGEHDILCDPRSLTGRFTKAKLNIIQNAGHLAQIEQPDIYNQAVFNALFDMI